ncbi:MAG: Tim44 domain-containing protein [Casimicrobiaceae bacterium]
MKRLLTVTLAVVAATALIAADVADAKRMGGGRSFGAQRQVTPTQPAAPSANSVAPAGTPNATMSNAVPATAAPNVAMSAKAATAAPSGMSRWLGPIAGIAAGLGLAALLSHLGLPEGFGTFLLLALLGVGAFFLIRMFLARRSVPRQPIQYAGAGAGLGNTPGGYETQAPPVAGTSAGTKFEPVWSGTQIPAPAAKWPAGFDAASFAQHAKLQFTQLQSAYDAGDRKALAAVMTPQMFAEVSQEIAARQTQVPTEIVTLDAEVLEVVTEGDRHWASVRFKGSLREDGALAQAFDEVWNLTKPVDGSSGWLLAGIQQLA